PFSTATQMVTYPIGTISEQLACRRNIYMANQLSKRIKAEKIDQIEMQFLHPADTESLIYKYNNKPIIATTPASGYPIPVYRLRQVSG
ncbi:MAG: hypothetical protein ACXWN0_17435, partial [Isosphaeraceae bacterium]